MNLTDEDRAAAEAEIRELFADEEKTSAMLEQLRAFREQAATLERAVAGLVEALEARRVDLAVAHIEKTSDELDKLNAATEGLEGV